MEQIFKITSCQNGCPFFNRGGGDGMSCEHPYWKDKNNWGKLGCYSNHIIDHRNSHNGNTPDECPLKKEPITITYKL